MLSLKHKLVQNRIKNRLRIANLNRQKTASSYAKLKYICIYNKCIIKWIIQLSGSFYVFT